MATRATPGPYAVRSTASVRDIERDTWDRLLSGEPESWEFYATAELSPPAGFELGALVASRGDTIVGVAPLFRTAYRLDTPLQGTARKVTDWLEARAPRLVSLPVIGIGSPMSDNCALGLAPELTREDCVEVFDAMLGHLEEVALEEGRLLIAVKSMDRSEEVLAPAFGLHGFRRVTTVPLVMLDLPYRSLDEYLRALPKRDGAYLRRKMRSAADVRIEYPQSIAGLEVQISRLFASTLHNSRVDYGEFQDLGPDYFANVTRTMGEKAQVMLCWRGDELLSFQLSLIGTDRIVAKQIGMKYPEARDLNLYFVNWLKLIEYAIDNRIPCIEMGATTYATKLLFGGRLERRWLHFRFRRAISNAAFSPLGRFLDFERNDRELQALAPAVRADMGPRLSRIGARPT